jgi:hypothetical protein
VNPGDEKGSQGNIFYLYKSCGFFAFKCFLVIILARLLGSYKYGQIIATLALFLNPLFIRNFGYVGAAWAMLVCSVLGAMISGAYIFRLLQVKYPVLSLLRVSGATLICYFLAILASGYTVGIRYGLYFCLFLLFAGILHFSREWASEDWQNVKDIFIKQ